VTAGQEIMLISSTGTLVRTPVDQISVVGRNTQGVRLIRLAEGERLTGIERVESLEGLPENGGETSGETAASGSEAPSSEGAASSEAPAGDAGPSASDPASSESTE
jgi:DNA gyrase subunit A